MLERSGCAAARDSLCLHVAGEGDRVLLTSGIEHRRAHLRASTAVAATVLAAIVLWSAPAQADARSVSAPSSVTVGKPVSLRVTGFRPGARVAVQLIPTENLGGNCCGRLLPGKRIGPSGTATIRFVWPATYIRTGGVGLTSNVDWGDRQSVTIDVHEPTAIGRSARTRTRVRNPRTASPSQPLGPAPGPRPGASPPFATALPPFEPGLGVTWEPPPFSTTLLDLKGGSRVPFDLVVSGSVSGSGMVQITSTPSFDGSPAKVYSVSGSGGSLSFSLLNGAWTPTSGMVGPTTSAQLALSWPAFSDGALTLLAGRRRERG